MSASGPLLIVLLLMVAIFACLSQIYRVSTKMQLLSLCVFIGSAHIPAELCLLVSPFTRPSFPIFRWGAHVREGRGGSGDDTNNILFSHQTLLPPSPLTPPINCREGSVPPWIIERGLYYPWCHARLAITMLTNPFWLTFLMIRVIPDPSIAAEIAPPYFTGLTKARELHGSRSILPSLDSGTVKNLLVNFDPIVIYIANPTF